MLSFDTVSQEWLIRFVEHRVGDRRIIRLIQKWLKAGVLEDEPVSPFGWLTAQAMGTGLLPAPVAQFAVNSGLI